MDLIPYFIFIHACSNFYFFTLDGFTNSYHISEQSFVSDTVDTDVVLQSNVTFGFGQIDAVFAHITTSMDQVNALPSTLFIIFFLVSKILILLFTICPFQACSNALEKVRARQLKMFEDHDTYWKAKHSNDGLESYHLHLDRQFAHAFIHVTGLEPPQLMAHEELAKDDSGLDPLEHWSLHYRFRGESEEYKKHHYDESLRISMQFAKEDVDALLKAAQEEAKQAEQAEQGEQAGQGEQGQEGQHADAADSQV